MYSDLSRKTKDNRVTRESSLLGAVGVEVEGEKNESIQYKKARIISNHLKFAN